MPIGLLAAIGEHPLSPFDSPHAIGLRKRERGLTSCIAFAGTPMAKKPIWRSRKCQILCPILGIITLLASLRLPLSSFFGDLASSSNDYP